MRGEENSAEQYAETTNDEIGDAEEGILATHDSPGRDED